MKALALALLLLTPCLALPAKRDGINSGFTNTCRNPAITQGSVTLTATCQGPNGDVSTSLDLNTCFENNNGTVQPFPQYVTHLLNSRDLTHRRGNFGNSCSCASLDPTVPGQMVTVCTSQDGQPTQDKVDLSKFLKKPLQI